MIPALYLRAGLIGAALVAVIAYGEWRAGMARQAAETAILEAYQQTIEDMSNADIPVDPSDVERRLCELAGIECDL